MSFPRYGRYKDSGVEWLGEVPEHWSVTPLKRIASICYGIGEPPVYRDAGTPLIRATNVHAGKLSAEGMVFVDPADIPSARIVWLLGGDIIVVRSGAYTGDSAIIPWDFGPCIAGFDMVLRAKTVWPSFLQFALLSSYLKEGQIEIERTRAAQPHLNAEELGSSMLLLPSPSEQESIANFLEYETAKIDALIQEQQYLIELLKEKRQAVISHAVTRGLNPNVKMKDSDIEWIGEVPSSWNIKPLRMVADVRGGVAKGRDLGKSESINVPYLRVANVQDGYLDLTEIATIDITAAELERYRLRSGDVLMNEGGDFDKLGRGHIWRGEIDDCIHQNHVFSVRPKDIDPEWLTLISTADCGRFYFMTRSKQSTNLASISSSNLGELPVPVPPAAERREILARVHVVTKAINTLIDNATSATALLHERRAALISAAVTGKIDVRNYTPKGAA